MIGRPAVNLVNSIVTSIISISLYLTLIPRYGMTGAAVSFAVSIAFINILRILQVYKFLGILPFKLSLLKIFVSAGLASLAVCFLKNIGFLQAVPIGWVAEMAAFWIVYAASTWLLKLDEADLAVLKALKQRIFLRKKT
jgi:O-antigen/teichoic acid export membrane protein